MPVPSSLYCFQTFIEEPNHKSCLLCLLLSAIPRISLTAVCPTSMPLVQLHLFFPDRLDSPARRPLNEGKTHDLYNLASAHKINKLLRPIRPIRYVNVRYIQTGSTELLHSELLAPPPSTFIPTEPTEEITQDSKEIASRIWTLVKEEAS